MIDTTPITPVTPASTAPVRPQPQMPSGSMPQPKVPTSPKSVQHHPIRAVLSSVFGALAVLFIFSSLLTVWVNRTLTDTNSYVAAVAPLAKQPAVQKVIAEKVTDQIIKDSSFNQIASQIVPAQVLASQPSSYVQDAVRTSLMTNVLQVVQSPRFAKLWETTNRTAHTQLISQLNSGADQVTFDFTPLVSGILEELRSTPLAGLSGIIQIQPDAAVEKVTGPSGLHKRYEVFKAVPVVLVILSLVSLTLCVTIATNHMQTLRRILFGVGISMLLLAGVLATVTHLSVGGSDPLGAAAAMAVFTSTTRALKNSALLVGIVCVVLAVSSKLVSLKRARTHTI